MNQPYVLDRSDRELDRLDLQGIIYRDITHRALERCGIGAGMRVLDVGCGSGDVTRLTASLVGSVGTVLGVDIDPVTIRAAGERCEELGVDNAACHVGEAGNVAEAGAYDALVGRFFLMHQRAPARTLAAAARAVRPGGVIMMLESHMAGLPDTRHSRPASGLYDEIVRWKCRVVGSAGADLEAGLGLYATFLDAGLPAPEMLLEAPVEGGPESPIYRYMSESVRSMLPMAAANGIGGFDASRVETLEAELRAAVTAANGVLVCWPAVSAWCRLPGNDETG